MPSLVPYPTIPTPPNPRPWQVFGDKYLAAFRLDFIAEEPAPAAAEPEATAAPADAPAAPETPAAPAEAPAAAPAAAAAEQ